MKVWVCIRGCGYEKSSERVRVWSRKELAEAYRSQAAAAAGYDNLTVIEVDVDGK